jgi:pyrimidine 5'-nucleotidase
MYQVNEAHYLQYVHAVNLSDYLHPEDQLAALLDSLPQRKIILTNSDINHAHNVLSFLEIEHFFEFIIDVNQLSPYVKPQKESFSKALQLAKLNTSAGCVFMDDHLPSVQNAAEMGFLGIFVGQDAESQYPYQIADIYGLPEILSQVLQ